MQNLNGYPLTLVEKAVSDKRFQVIREKGLPLEPFAQWQDENGNTLNSVEVAQQIYSSMIAALGDIEKHPEQHINAMEEYAQNCVQGYQVIC